MKRWGSEFGHSYETYSFGYCNWAERETDDALSDIYASGFLPYSGEIEKTGVFYMARSARVDLTNFKLSSENRRVAKKFDSTLKKDRVSITAFDYNDRNFISFCTDYFAKRHGPDVMPEKRLLRILSADLITHIVRYKKDTRVIAYVFEVSDSAMRHFWYSFYDLAYANQSLGLWLMLDILRDAKKSKQRYCYLGTLYGKKGLYKMNFSPLEYWDGALWSRDPKALKRLIETDERG